MSYNIEKIRQKINECETIFFDLDGTLIDTEPLYFRFWKESALFYGYEMSDQEALDMRSRDKEASIEALRKISNGLLEYEAVKAKRIELMDAYLANHPIKIKSGVVEFLEKLQSENKKLYIVTANTVQKASNIIKSLNLDRYFIDIISAKDVKRGKPYPYVYLKACEIVKIKSSDVVVFEDSPNGLKSSHYAGCFTIMVEDMSPFSEEMDYVDGAIKSFEEIL